MSADDENTPFSGSDNKAKIVKFLATCLKIIPVFILVIAMVGAAINLRNKQDPRSKASVISEKINKSDRIRTINTEFLNYVRSNKGQAVSQQLADNLRSLAAERKQLMLSFLPDDPDKFLENVLPESVKQNLPQNLLAENLIETKQTVKGKLNTTVYDDFENQSAKYEYTLDGLNLYISEKSGPLQYGDMTVNGYLIDNNLIVADPQLNISYGPLNRYEVFGPQRTLMVIVDADYDPAEITTQALDTAIFGVTSSAATYYKETSRDKMSLIGEVKKPYVDFSSVANKCYIHDLISQTDSVLSQLGLILDDYRIIQYYLPKPPGCSWGFSGIALTEKRSVVAWNEYINKGISIHEMGHNFGLAHASTYNCGNKAFGTESECQIIEYGDNFDIMGLASDNAPVFNGPHKLALSWIDENEYSFVKNDQEVEIYAHEIADPGLKIVRIWRNVDNNYIYLTFRKKVGIDTVLPDTIIRGVNVHLTQAISDSTKTLFIDATPDELRNIESWNDASLFDGQTLIDELSGIKITQVSHTADKAVVQIDLPDNYPPKLISANFNGLSKLPDGRWFAYQNTLIQSLIFGYDFSDDMTISREVTYPDGTKNTSDMTVSPHVGSKLCEEIKCFDGTGGNFLTYQAGSYKLTFTARDSKGADSNPLVYEFIVSSVPPPSLTPTSTRTPTPTYMKITPTPTPSRNLTPKLTLTPTPTGRATPTPTPTGPIKITPTPTVTPTQLTLEPVADSFVNSNYPNSNSGKESDLKVKTTPTKITFIKFNLTSLALYKFNSAKLKVWVNDPSSGITNIYIVPDNSWTETGITYNNRPALGSLITSFTANSSYTYKEIDITEFMKSNSGKVISFAFQTTSTNELSFKSRNIADSSRHPLLVIQ